MAYIAEYKAKIVDYRYNMTSSIDSYRKSFLNNTHDYIVRSREKLLSKPAFALKHDVASAVFHSYQVKIEEKIQEFVEDMIKKQIEEIDQNVLKPIEEFEKMTWADIEEEIYKAEHSISQITEEKMKELDSFVEKNIEDTIEEYINDSRVNIDLSERSNLKASYLEDFNHNFSVVKKEFTSRSRTEVERYYENTKYVLREKKLEDPEKENEDVTKYVDDVNNEFAKDVSEDTQVDKKAVSEVELNIDFVTLDVISKYLNVYIPINLTTENNRLVGTNTSNEPFEIKKNDDVVKFTDYNSETSYALKIDDDEKLISVKFNDSNMIVFETQSNRITLTTDVLGSRKDFEFNFENGNTIVYELNGNEKKPVENVEALIQSLEQNNIKVMDVINNSIDLSRTSENTQRS